MSPLHYPFGEGSTWDEPSEQDDVGKEASKQETPEIVALSLPEGTTSHPLGQDVGDPRDQQRRGEGAYANVAKDAERIAEATRELQEKGAEPQQLSDEEQKRRSRQQQSAKNRK
jgi:hypothetical protein